MENALAGEKSPYLLQHKDNPVDWHPWGEAAFEKARRENKPVFLSIGYSTCHWCHVMAHESFENPAIAALMNRGFVNIKVDREERPDVDRVYMAYVQAATGGGGWPMSVWLTPDGHPFFGGTYFPPDGRYGRAGFPQILQQIENLWGADRGRIESEAGRALAVLREASAGGSAGPLEAGWLEGGYRAFASAFDARHGGFGGAPKFPRPSVLNFLMRGDGEARRMVLETLRAMSRGGIRDQLGGGFHRYSVDALWHVPHFEKMLYDQAQITVSLVEAWQITKDPFFEATARSTLDYVLRDMTHPSGGFYSAEDADSLIAQGSDEHAEGAFYVWTRREIEALLPPVQARVFCEYFGVKDDGNAPDGSDPHGELAGKNIPVASREEAEPASIAAAKEILLAHRNLRPRPHLDDKILTAWNGLMISAFARAGRAFGDRRYISAAVRAADFVMGKLRRDGDLLRSWRGEASDIPGFAEDHAFFIQGLMDLYEADFQIRFLKQAIKLQQRQDVLFRAGDGYFSNRAGDPLVPVRMKEDYDGAEPSANSVSALNLLRLSRLVGDPSYENSARKILEAHSVRMERIPSAVPQMLVALDLALSPPSQAVVVGSRPDAEPLLAPLSQEFRPHTAVILLDSPEAFEFFGRYNPAIREMRPSDAGPQLHLCENFACQSTSTTKAQVTKRCGKIAPACPEH